MPIYMTIYQVQARGEVVYFPRKSCSERFARDQAKEMLRDEYAYIYEIDLGYLNRNTIVHLANREVEAVAINKRLYKKFIGKLNAERATR